MFPLLGHRRSFTLSRLLPRRFAYYSRNNKDTKEGMEEGRQEGLDGCEETAGTDGRTDERKRLDTREHQTHTDGQGH